MSYATPEDCGHRGCWEGLVVVVERDVRSLGPVEKALDKEVLCMEMVTSVRLICI